MFCSVCIQYSTQRQAICSGFKSQQPVPVLHRLHQTCGLLLLFLIQICVMSATTGRPPDLTPHVVANLVCKLFPFKAVDKSSVNQLDSFHDRNFYFCGTLDLEALGDESCNSREFVLKLLNPLLTSYEVTEGLSVIMRHLNQKGFNCSWPLRGRRRNEIEMISERQLVGEAAKIGCSEERTFCACVLVFVPGKLMDKVERKYLTPELLYNIGNYAGQMNAALQVIVTLYNSDVSVLYKAT